MDNFTLATGLASLFGFIIQIFDLFPKYREARARVLFALGGAFVGSVLRAIQPGTVKLDIELTGYSILVGGFALAIVQLLFYASFQKDASHRVQLLSVCAWAFIGFLVVAGIGYSITHQDPPGAEAQRLTIHELDVLAQQAEQAKDYERAVMHLKTIEGRITNPGDSRRQSVEDRVKALEAESLQK